MSISESIAKAFFTATNRNDTEQYSEADCLTALRSLTSASEFQITANFDGGFRIRYQSGAAMTIGSAKDTLRFLSENHRSSSIWMLYSFEDFAATFSLASTSEKKGILAIAREAFELSPVRQMF